MFKRKVLLAVKKVKAAHRSVVVRTAKNRVHHDPDAAFKGDGIGRIPSGCRHRANDLCFRADKTDVERVARMAVRGVGDAIRVGQDAVVPEIDLPDPGNEQIRGGPPSQNNPKKHPPTQNRAESPLRVHNFGGRFRHRFWWHSPSL